MSRIRKMATAAATFSVALGIGFVMQNGDALAGRLGALPQDQPGVAPLAAPGPRTIVTVENAAMTPVAMVIQPSAQPAFAAMPVSVADLSGLPRMTAQFAVQIGRIIAPSGVATSMPASTVAAVPESVVEAAPAAVIQPAAFEESPQQATPPASVVSDGGCSATLTATPMDLGMAHLTLLAPCSPGQAVMVHHDGMMFTAVTDLGGQMQVTVPALSVNAVFVVDLGQGRGAVATATLPEVAGLDRAVVQGRAGMGLALHAFVDGAAFGAPGHVWQDQSGRPGDAAGFLTSLGTVDLEGAFVAQVYTGPFGTADSVALMTEATVTPGNCGQGLAAQTLQLSPGGPVFVRDLSMAMPDCAALGEFVVLPESLLDLTLAAN